MEEWRVMAIFVREGKECMDMMLRNDVMLTEDFCRIVSDGMAAAGTRSAGGLSVSGADPVSWAVVGTEPALTGGKEDGWTGR